MQTHTDFADVNGTRLYYEIAGAGPPLVLIHGFSVDSRMWDDQFDVFAQHYQVLRYDARGFGKSALPTSEPYTHAEDLHVLVQYLGIARATLVGLSMGGRIAINFALAYPTATAALVPVDAALDGYQGEAESPLILLRRTAERDGLQAAKAVWLNHPLLASACKKPVLATRLNAMIAEYSGWHFTNHDPGRVSDPAAIERLDTITVPTLVLVGEQDTLDCRRIADILAQSIPCATKVVMPGVGHIGNMEDPVRFNEIILGFLAEQATKSC